MLNLNFLAPLFNNLFQFSASPCQASVVFMSHGALLMPMMMLMFMVMLMLLVILLYSVIASYSYHYHDNRLDMNFLTFKYFILELSI